jgi:delta 1-pyrroline-5-carboxylate dehydrogenase
LLGFVVAALVAWSANLAIPHFVHRSPANRLLGILPAAGVALMILVLGLGVGERLAASPTDLAFLRSGILTGPLVDTGDLIEQMVAGVH